MIKKIIYPNIFVLNTLMPFCIDQHQTCKIQPEPFMVQKGFRVTS